MNSGSWNLSPPVFSFKIFCSSTFPLHYTKVSPFWCVYGWERSTFFCSTKVFLALVIFFISILAPILLYYSAHLEFLNYTSGCLWFAGGCFLSSPILFLTGPPYRSLFFFSFGDQNSISGWQSCHCRWECGCPNCQQPSFQWQKCYSIKQRNYDYLDNKIHHRYWSLKTKH